MVNGTGLSSWTTHSEIVRATSRDAEGPYTLQETILKPFAHGPTVRSLGKGKGFVLMHLGCGRAPTEAGQIPCNQFNVSVMTAPRLTGPWSESKQVFLSSGKAKPSWYVPSGRQFSNPQPYILANGSVICAYRADARSGGEHVSIAKADTVFGPYLDERTQPIVTSWSEDPFLWQDERGHWHMLMHGSPARQNRGGAGGHSFSRSIDGPWTLSTVGPYTKTVVFTDGTNIKMQRRERPQLILSESGQPRYFSSGVADPTRKTSGVSTYTLVMRVNTDSGASVVV